MDEMIGFCGYKCDQCAARSDDPVERQKLVDGWRKVFGHQNYTVENVRCDGCRSRGRLADKSCKARPCALAKGVDSCALCDDFPCNKMSHLMGDRTGMLLGCYPKTMDLTEEEYDRCMRQFESRPVLIQILAEAGNLPPWVVKKSPTSGKV